MREILLPLVWFTVLAAIGCLPVSDWEPPVTTKEDIERLPKHQNSVRCIDIGDLQMLTVGEHLAQLEFLYINTKSTITDEGIVALRSLKHLRQVVLMNCSLLTDDGLNVFGEMTSLTELMMDGGTLITDEGLWHLSGNRNFRTISFSHFPRVTNAGVQRLRQSLPGCRDVNSRHLREFSEQGASNR
jgi:hypothetical protein